MTISRIRAVLGSTNTGKTHLACVRLLAHKSGMIGLPLRLLAREVYDRTINGDFGAVHRADVALITGEERIMPPNPRYYICTSEAMPTHKEVAFAALDECQLANDRERGHIFTDRILYMRGTQETLFLGAETMAPLLKRLVPDIEIETRQRFSQLRYTRPRKLSRLPRRTAIIAFSANDVYALADIMRRQHGGVGIVMGSLSPRTRNAQVAMYQSGEVDYLVATDAIGMGLNMDIDHIAFAALRKFDGKKNRALTPAELAQIAGRAGRHTNNGSFSMLADMEDTLDEESILRIETHDFEPVKTLMWRNRRLDFSSLTDLIASLEQPPTKPALMRVQNSDDLRALKIISRDINLDDESRLRQLWQCAQIPDYRKTTAGAHAALIAQIFSFCDTDTIPDEWMAEQIKHCDKMDGDIDALSTRLAHIRTCTYIAQHKAWLKDAQHWQEVSQAVETRLSDSLHAQLMGKFVDRKSATLLRHLAEHDSLTADISDDGTISLSGQILGAVRGLTIERSPALATLTIGAARAAFDKAAQYALTQKAAAIIKAEDTAFTLSSHPHSYAAIFYKEEPCATLYIAPQNHNPTAYLAPQIRLLADTDLSAQLTAQLTQRLKQWLNDYSQTQLAALHKLTKTDDLTSDTKGLIFRLTEHYGNLPRYPLAQDIQSIIARLDTKARQSLRRYGIRLGYYNIYIPALLKTHAAFLLAQTHALATNTQQDLSHLPKAGITSAKRSTDNPALYRAYGFHPTKNYVIRFDILERVGDILRPYVKTYTKTKEMFCLPPENINELLSRLGCAHTTLIEILDDLGYTHIPEKEATEKPESLYFTVKETNAQYKTKNKKHKKPQTDSAFAALQALKTPPKSHETNKS